jgi:tetratricopeptide (TPR) repeat protein
VLLTGGLLCLAAPGVHAAPAGQLIGARGGPDAERLADWAGDLDHGEASVRRQAYRALSTLDAEALPAIRQRVEDLSGEGQLEDRVARQAISSIRHEVGSRRADDMVDIAPGVLPRLKDTREEATLRAAERLALLRSLEHIATPAAGRVIADLLAVHYSPWKWESRRIVDRMGIRALPWLIEVRRHDRPGIRRWGRWGRDHLGMEEPGKAIQAAQEHGPELLAAVIRAYGKVRDMDAMPIVVSFVSHGTQTVRRAARKAVDRYGQNCIWQLRRAYRIHAGQDADTSWGWKRTRRELYQVLDAERLGPARQEMKAGLEAKREGKLGTMAEHFRQALRMAPAMKRRREMAPGFAELAETKLQKGQLTEATSAYRRALALAPDAGQAESWRAELAFTRAERKLAQGVVDPGAYRRVLQLAPGHPQASKRLDVLSGAAAERARTRRKWAAGAAALLLGLVAYLLLFRRRRDESEAGPEPGDEHDSRAEPMDMGELIAQPQKAFGSGDTLAG